MMTSSKYLDLKLFWVIFMHFLWMEIKVQEIEKHIHKFNREAIVTLGYKMTMSSKCLDLDCFELFSCIFIRKNIIPWDWKKISWIWQWAYSHSMVKKYDNVLKMLKIWKKLNDNAHFIFFTLSLNIIWPRFWPNQDHHTQFDFFLLVSNKVC